MGETQPGSNPSPMPFVPNSLKGRFQPVSVPRLLRRAAAWPKIDALLCLLPLGWRLIGPPPGGRGFWVEFAVALGMIGFGMQAAQCLTTARFPWVAPGIRPDGELIFHRRAAILAFFVFIGHPVVLRATDASYLAYFDPRATALRAIFLSAAVVGLVLLVALPEWRLSFGLSYEWWRLTHGSMTVGVLLVAIAHVIQVGHYTNTLGKQLDWVLFGAGAMGLVLHTRLVKPLMVRRRPHRVTQVREEHGSVCSLVLEPDGDNGLPFVAGPYAWITRGDSPFTLQQHPFAMASSDTQPERMEFGIKEFGDFTTSIKNTAVGTRAFVEGPYGALTLDPDPNMGGFFVAGGIGVTPFLSMLRSARHRQEQRPRIWSF